MFARMKVQLNEKLYKDWSTHFGVLRKDEQKVMQEKQDRLVSTIILALLYAGGRYCM